MTILEYVFGMASLFGFFLAAYAHAQFKGVSMRFISKLRCAREDIARMGMTAQEIVRACDGTEDHHCKLAQIRQAAQTVLNSYPRDMNKIDNDCDWSRLTEDDIYKQQTGRSTRLTTKQYGQGDDQPRSADR